MITEGGIHKARREREAVGGGILAERREGISCVYSSAACQTDGSPCPRTGDGGWDGCRCETMSDLESKL